MMRPAAVLAWCTLIAITAVHLPRLTFDNDTWLPPGNPQRLQLDNFRAAFEPDEVLLVVIELEQGLFEPQQTQRIKNLDAALAGLPETRSVLSPLSATTIIDTGDTLQINSFDKALQNNLLVGADAYREKFLHSPYAGKLLSDDQRTVLLRVAIPRVDSKSRTAAMAAIVATLRHHDFPSAHFAGEAALKNELNHITRDQLPFLLILVAVVLAVFLRVACGNWLRATLIFTATTAAVVSCLGIMAAFNWPMNAILLALPVMVAVIAVADGLHILACWDALAASAQDTRLGETIRQTWLPCLGATVTSAAGFGAFAISELTPLQHFGKASALAILYAYPLIVGALWGGLWLFPGLAHAPKQRFGWKRLVAFANRQSKVFPWRVIAIMLCFTVPLGGGLGFIRTETNFLSVFFADDSAVHQSFDLVDDRLGGSGRIEVILRGEAEEAFAEISNMHTVETLSQRFADLDKVNNVDSYLLPITMADEAFGGGGLPQTDQVLSQELLFLSLSRNETERDVLSPYLDFNQSSARLSLQTPNLDSQPLQQTITAIGTIADDRSAIITGFGVFIHSLGKHVLHTQAVSIALTLLIIGALLLLQFGFRLGLCGLVVNILPLAATAGLLAWLNYPYDFAAILIAGVTLGLSVDDTIHFLHHYKRAGNDASRYTLERTARPIVVTTLLFCCGLSILAFSELVVLQRFAAFTMFGMGASLISVLLFLPALLAIFVSTTKPLINEVPK